MKPYYYIKDGNTFTRKYDTLEEAESEAIEIASDYPGRVVEILRCIGLTSTQKATTFWMDGVIPPHECCFSRGLDDVCFVCGNKV